MIHAKHNMNKWKKDQLKYFKGYLNSFEKDSREYQLISEGIRELEANL